MERIIGMILYSYTQLTSFIAIFLEDSYCSFALMNHPCCVSSFFFFFRSLVLLTHPHPHPQTLAQVPNQRSYNQRMVLGCFSREEDALPVATELSVDW